MINDIKSVTIKGEFFSNPIEWEFLSVNEKDRFFLIYGCNGSGKTTFSKAIFEYKNSTDGTFKNFEEVYFKDKSNNILNLNKDNIWSFNDEFTQKNVRIKNSGINAIVMFGEAGDIDSQIETCKKELSEYLIKQKEIDLNKYNTPKNLSCIQDSYALIINALKGDWASNDKNIKDSTRNSSVSDKIVDKILNVNKSKDTLSSLKKKFDDKLKLYKSLPKDATVISSLLSSPLPNSNDTIIIEALNKKINQPVFGDLENKILEELNKENTFINIENTKKVIENSDICPLCFQFIEKGHKHSIIEAINKVFDDEAQNHINYLKNLNVNEIVAYDFEPFLNVVDGTVQSNINNLVNQINNIISKYRNAIEAKIKNVFVPIELENLELDTKTNELQKLITEVNKKILEYNENVKSINNIKNDLILMNEQMAYITIKDLYDNYQKLLTAKKEDEEQFVKYSTEIEKLNKNIKELNAKKKNLNLGLKEINDDLLIIFHTRSKLQLVLEDGKYYVESRGRRIQFNDLSVGEKNVIGLCYFFSLIRNNHSKSDVFNDEMLVVLDDPISSFDFNNKYGIYSYLKKMLNELLKKNIKTKVVILTHELETMGNLDKIRADLGYTRKNFKIKNQKLEKYDVESSNYKNMIVELVELVHNNSIITSENINTTRRILEAFCQFVYNMSLNEFSRDETIFSTIDDEKVRSYLYSTVYRFVLNNESHTAEAIKGMPQNMGYDSYSEDEKKQVIKDTILLIYNLNQLHLKKVIKDTDKVSYVENWHNDLLNELNGNIVS